MGGVPADRADQTRDQRRTPGELDVDTTECLIDPHVS